MPLACAAASPSATCRAIASASRIGERPRRRARPGASRPSTHSIAIHGDALGIADVVDRDDRRMVQNGRGARLELEPAAKPGIPTSLGRDDLERDVATEPRVAAAIDLSHPADPEKGLDVVGAETISGLERHGRSVRMISPLVPL